VHARAAHATSQQTRKQIRRVGGAARATALAARGRVHFGEARLYRIPELRVHNRQLRAFLADPVIGRPHDCPPSPRVRVLQETRLVPDPDAAIALVVQDRLDARECPAASRWPALGVLGGGTARALDSARRRSASCSSPPRTRGRSAARCPPPPARSRSAPRHAVLMPACGDPALLPQRID